MLLHGLVHFHFYDFAVLYMYQLSHNPLFSVYFACRTFFQEVLILRRTATKTTGALRRRRVLLSTQHKESFIFFVTEDSQARQHTQNKNRKRGETLRNSWQESRQQHRNSGLYKQGPKHKERNGYSRTTAKQDSCCAQ